MAWTPVAFALVAMLTSASLFEPMRNALWPLGSAVGGVGGVGGLTNQYAANPLCNHTAAYTRLYCYHAGILGGLTPFALITLLVWVSPLLLAAFVTWLRRPPQKPAMPQGTNLVSGRSRSESSRPSRTGFAVLWVCLNTLWVSMPLCYYFSDKFYTGSAARVVLGLSLSASIPLSWNVMLVALPMNNFVAPLINWDRGDVYFAHRIVGATTATWGAIHGLGEVIYIIAEKQVASTLTLANGENLIYVSGLTLLVILTLHTAVALLRTKLIRWFALCHRTLATCFLLMASVHWWPFALFMVPVATTHGVACATQGGFGRKSWCSAVVREPAIMSLCLAVALSCGTVVLTIVWAFRQLYMERSDANRYIPFLFPPIALASVFISAIGCARLVLAICDYKEKNDADASTPLLADGAAVPESPLNE